MQKPRNALILVSASSLLLIASKRKDIEAADGDMLGGFSLGNAADNFETAFNVLTEQAANVDQATATANVVAFLRVLTQSEGTASQADPYRVCYGYRHTIQDLAEHPTITGEWGGEVLSDRMCSLAGFGPGCKSTAAGAYQINKPTWLDVKGRLGLRDFSQASQDAAAVNLVARCGALEDVKAGRFNEAVRKCRNRWASLPGNSAGQGQRTYAQLGQWFTTAGGRMVA